MIFVTVGTHEQPFNRLVEYMDYWAEKHEEKVIIQTGFSTYHPKFAEYKKLYSYQEMKTMVREARIVITHGGPSSFVMALEFGKKPIVVPRQVKYGEHVNDHQLFFCKEVEERMESIIVVEDINKLSEVINQYDVTNKHSFLKRNNATFCREFSKIVEELFTK